MNVSLHYILENPLFEHAQLLAGADGCFRTVERVSVFDSPFGMDVIEQGIIAPGDFFVTGLLQFSADSDALFGYGRSDYRSVQRCLPDCAAACTH